MLRRYRPVDAGRGPGQGGIRDLPQAAVSDLEAAVAARDRLGRVDASPQPGELFRQARRRSGRLGWALIGVRPDGCGELSYGALELYRKGEREVRPVCPGSPPRVAISPSAPETQARSDSRSLTSSRPVICGSRIWVTVSPPRRAGRVFRATAPLGGSADIYTGATRQVRLKPAPKVVKMNVAVAFGHSVSGAPRRSGD